MLFFSPQDCIFRYADDDTALVRQWFSVINNVEEGCYSDIFPPLSFPNHFISESLCSWYCCYFIWKLYTSQPALLKPLQDNWHANIVGNLKPLKQILIYIFVLCSSVILKEKTISEASLELCLSWLVITTWEFLTDDLFLHFLRRFNKIKIMIQIPFCFHLNWSTKSSNAPYKTNYSALQSCSYQLAQP